MDARWPQGYGKKKTKTKKTKKKKNNKKNKKKTMCIRITALERLKPWNGLTHRFKDKKIIAQCSNYATHEANRKSYTAANTNLKYTRFYSSTPVFKLFSCIINGPHQANLCLRAFRHDKF